MSYRATVQGLDELQRKFEKSPEIVSGEMRTAMQKSTITLASDIRPETPVFMGILRNSIGSDVSGTGSKIVGTVGSSLKDEAYPAVMEHGREPAPVPPGKLERWVKIKLGVTDTQVTMVARKIAHSISLHGIKGRFFMKKGFEKAQGKILGYFQEALKRIVERL